MNAKHARNRHKRSSSIERADDQLKVTENSRKKYSVSSVEEAIVFVKSQKYFQNFTAEQQSEYIKRISEFNFEHPRLRKLFKLFFSADYLLDEHLLRYTPADEPSATETVFTFSILIVAFLFRYLVDNSTMLYGWLDVHLPVSPLATCFIVFGTLLVGLDILVKGETIHKWDRHVIKYVKDYESSWVNAIKVGFIINGRRTTDFLDWIINATVTIAFILYLLNLHPYPSVSFLGLICMFGFYSCFFSVHRLPQSRMIAFFYLVGAISFFQQIGFQTLLHEQSKNGFYLLGYYQVMAGTRNLYDFLPSKRRLIYYVLILLGFPWLLIKTMARTIPFMILIPVYGTVRFICLLKPNSVLRFLGMLLVITGYLFEKYL